MDHAVDVAGDAPVVALVQLLERAVVARTYARDQVVVGDVIAGSSCDDRVRSSRDPVSP
jgi:hypothetical protein